MTTPPAKSAHAQQPWFTPVLVLAVVLLLVGWHIGDLLSNSSRTFQGKGFSFEYAGHWQAIGADADHPNATGPADARFTALGKADASVVRLNQLEDPGVAITIRSAPKPTFSVSLDQTAFNDRTYTDYKATADFKEVAGSQPQSYKLDFSFNQTLSTTEKINCIGEDRIYVNGDQMVVITYTAPAAVFAKDYGQFEAMLASVKFDK
jgi:hypothetical protein